MRKLKVKVLSYYGKCNYGKSIMANETEPIVPISNTLVGKAINIFFNGTEHIFEY